MGLGLRVRVRVRHLQTLDKGGGCLSKSRVVIGSAKVAHLRVRVRACVRGWVGVRVGGRVWVRRRVRGWG